MGQFSLRCWRTLTLEEATSETSNVAQNDLASNPAISRREGKSSRRLRYIRILFVHDNADLVVNCLQKLMKARFVVKADVVLTLAQCNERLRSHSYEIVVAGYPSPSWKDSQALELIHQTVPKIPLLFMTSASGSEPPIKLTPHSAFYYVERDHLAELPLTVRDCGTFKANTRLSGSCTPSP